MYERFDPRAALLNGAAGERFWVLEPNKVKLIGGGAPFSEFPLSDNEDGLATLKHKFPHSSFYLTKLQAGEYYPLMARPSSCVPSESPGDNPDLDSDGLTRRARVLSSGQIDALIEQLKKICQTIHPEGDNLRAFGHDVRNILILACTEVEAQWKYILSSNSYSSSKNMNIRKDYVKILRAMKLNEYEVELTWYPWVGAAKPFEEWARTGMLLWYLDYNKVKHDRLGNFEAATLRNAMAAVAGCFIMLCAQFGWDFARRGPEASSAFFRLIRGPSWSPSELYVPGTPRRVNYDFA